MRREEKKGESLELRDGFLISTPIALFQVSTPNRIRIMQESWEFSVGWRNYPWRFWIVVCWQRSMTVIFLAHKFLLFHTRILSIFLLLYFFSFTKWSNYLLSHEKHKIYFLFSNTSLFSFISHSFTHLTLHFSLSTFLTQRLWADMILNSII